MKTENDKVSELRELDRLCDQFESQYSPSGKSLIPDFQKKVERPQRRQLLNMLVAIEMELLSEKSETPTLDQYQQRLGLEPTAVQDAYARAVRQLPTQIGHTESFHAGGELRQTKLAADIKSINIRGLEIQNLIGRGGMGAVYCARQKALNRLAAVKMLPKDRVQDTEARLRFQREMEAVGKLQHPNIVQAYDAELDEDQPFLLMELVQGLDLSQLVRSTPQLSVSHACEIVRQAALGLQYAHTQGIVHRDIKPSNLMLDPSGTVRILDFGLTRLWEPGEGDNHITETGIVFGSIHYMAPEQFQDSHNVDTRADIYSLGCVLYFLLTGMRPFGEGTKNPLTLLHAHSSNPVPALSQHRPDAPELLDQVLAKMLAKSPDDRYQDFNQVVVAVSCLASADGLGHAASGSNARPKSQAEIDTSRKLQTATLPVFRTKKRSIGVMRYLWLMASIAFFAIASVIIYVQTDYGTFRIEVLDPRVRVEVADEEVTIHDQERVIKLRAGKKKIRIRSAELNLDVEREFTLLRGDDEKVLHVVLLPDRGADLLPGPAPTISAPEVVANSKPQANVPGPFVFSDIPHLAPVQHPGVEPPFDGSPSSVNARRDWYLRKHLTRRELFRLHAPDATVGRVEFPEKVRLPLSTTDTSGLTAKYFRDREATIALDRTRLDELKLSQYYRAYFDAENRPIEITCFRADGTVSDGTDGFATTRHWYGAEGHLRQTAYFDTHDGLSQNEDGESIVLSNLQSADEPFEIRHYGLDGTASENEYGVYRRIQRSDGIRLDYQLNGEPKLEWLETYHLGIRLQEKSAWQPAFSPDGKELYFPTGWSGRDAVANSQIMVSRWSGARWSNPLEVIVEGRPLTGLRPTIAHNGNIMAVVAWQQNPYGNDREDNEYPQLENHGNGDIYFVQKRDGVWGEISNAGPEINSTETEEFGMAFDPVRSSLLFSRGRAGIWESVFDQGKWQPASATPFTTSWSPEVSADGQMLILGTPSERALSYALREEKAWGKFRKLDLSHKNATDCSLAANGAILYFSAGGGGWHIRATGRADSEIAIHHMAHLFAWEEWKHTGPSIAVELADARSVSDLSPPPSSMETTTFADKAQPAANPTAPIDSRVPVATDNTKLQPRLPAPVDRLQRSGIPPYELRVAARGSAKNIPPELVAIYGGSKLNHWRGVYALNVSRDGKFIASAGRDNALKLWNAETYELIWSAYDHPELIHDIAFSKSGQLLATGCNDGQIKIWNTQTGKCSETLLGHENSVRQVAFIENDQRLVSVGWDKQVRFWNLRTGKAINTLLGHDRFVVAMDISSDERLLATGGGDNTIRVWDLAKGKVIATLHGHTKEVHEVAFVPGRPLIVSGSHDGTARLWDIETQEEVRKYDIGADLVNAIAVSPSGDIVATGGGSLGLSIALWDRKSGLRLALLHGQHESVERLVFNSTGSRLYSASNGSSVHVWDVAKKSELSADVSPKGMRGIAVSPNGETFATISVDSNIYIGNLGTNSNLKKIKGHRSIGQDICFNADGTRLASGSSDGTVRVWDARTGRELWNKALQIGRTRSVAFHPNQDVVVVGGQQVFVLRVLDSNTGKEIRTLPGLDGDVQSVQFSPDGTRLAASTSAGTLFVFRYADGKLVSKKEKLHSGLHQASFSPSGTVIATAGRDDGIRLWSVTDLMPISHLEAATMERIDGLSFSLDGRLLAGIGWDCQLRIWNTADWTLRQTIDVAQSGSFIRRLAFTPDGRHVLTANENGTIYVLRLAEVD